MELDKVIAMQEEAQQVAKVKEDWQPMICGKIAETFGLLIGRLEALEGVMPLIRPIRIGSQRLVQHYFETLAKVKDKKVNDDNSTNS